MTASAPRPFPSIPDRIETIHIIGICGTAMGSLAAMLSERGYQVRGSDAMAYPPMSTWLESRGIDIMRGYHAENLDWDPDLVVVGNVCRAEYADAREMRRRGLPHMSLPEALQHFFFDDKRALVVTGTHGKTTTTSMLAWILNRAGRDPSFMVGGITGNFGSNYRLGDDDTFVIEGDEYDTAYFDKVPKFWHYRPLRATINNLEFDHADIYDRLEDIEHVFETFVAMIPEHGTLWVNGEDPRALAVSEGCPATRRTFGLSDSCDLFARNLRYTDVTTGEVVYLGETLGDFALPCIGEFNVRNMLGAIGLALDEQVSFKNITDALAEFKTVKKRQELVGEAGGVLVFDDFAHHPTAVGATVSALRKRFPKRKLWVVFEAKSNTSRRRVFQQDYPKAFQDADVVILSRPFKKDDNLAPEERLDIDELAHQIRNLGPQTHLIPDVDHIVDHLSQHVRAGDVVAGLSGSSFQGLHHKLLAKLRE